MQHSKLSLRAFLTIIHVPNEMGLTYLEHSGLLVYHLNSRSYDSKSSNRKFLEASGPQVSPNILLEGLQPMAWKGALFTGKYLVG